MTTNILHTADIHLRDSQFGRTERGRDFTKAMFQLVSIAEKNDVTYILAAGDILHTKRPSSQNITDMMEMNRLLLSRNMTMYCIAGNHDECNPNWLAMIEKESIKQTGKSAIKDVTNKLIALPDTDITLYGAPFPDMHPDDFREQCGKWPSADILLYHGAVKEFAFFPLGSKTLCIDDLPYHNYQVIALGDIHFCKYLTKDHCLIGYPGPIEYCSANEDPAKSCTILRFEDSDLLKFDARRDIIPIHTRRVVQREVQTEKDMHLLLDDLRALKGEKPIVHVWYNPAVNDVFTRLSAVIDPCDGIIRTIPKSSDKPIKVETNVSAEHDLQPSDFVSDFFRSEDPLYAVAMACCNSETKAGVVIDQFIETQLSEYYDDKKF